MVHTVIIDVRFDLIKANIAFKASIYPIWAIYSDLTQKLEQVLVRFSEVRTALDLLTPVRALIIIHSIPLVPPFDNTRITEDVLTRCTLLRKLQNHVADGTL